MLVLSRKPGERIQIGPDIWVTLVRLGVNSAKIGIEAPRGMNIAREELLLEILPRPAAAPAAEEVAA